MAFCSNCGTKAPDGVKFCPECGTRIMTAAQMNAAAPAPVVEKPAPAPVVEKPAPAPVVEKPAPAPIVERPAPQPIVERPAPAPVVEKPAAPAPKAEKPAPAPAAAPAKFEVGEDGLEYVPYVPVENPQPLVVPGAKKPAPAPKAAEPKKEAPAAAAPVALENEPEVVDAPPAPKKAPKEPKKGIAKFLPFIIIGGVALLAIFIGIIVLVVSLVKGAGGKVDENADPNLGLYNAVTAEMMGFEMGVEDLWANGFSIELQEKGKALLNIDGTKGKAKWTLEDGEFNVKGGGLDCSGTLENGEMVLENVMDMGVTLTFAKEGAMIDAPASPGELPGGDEPGVSAPASAIEEQWDGMWFGCVRFMECTGKYANYDYMNMDAFINIDVDANGKGAMQVYMGQDAGIPAFATAEIQAADYGIDTIGGKVLTFDMNTGSWMFRPTPDYEDRYVVYDTVEDGDGDHFEYMVFMKKWGNTWQPEIDTDFEIVPESAAYYEECIAGGAAAPVISDNTALASSLEEATGSQLNLDGAAAPAGDAAVTSEIALPSTWYGWVMLQDWWGDGEGEPMYDAWAFVDSDSEGRPFVDIKLDGYPDSAFMSMYMHLENDNTCIVPEIGDGDAWFNDTYLTPGDDDNYRMYLMEDGTLCASFTYESYTGEYGCEVVMCFRLDGTEWDEENDLLPLRYDEYKAALGANTEGAPVDEPAATVGGDGIMDFDSLKAGFKQVYDNGSGSTYAEIRDMFGGVDGKPKTIEDDFHSYRWATEDDKSFVLVSFKVDETGLEKYSGVSWSSDLKD